MIYDLDNNPLSSSFLDIKSNQLQEISVRIDCAAPEVLRCDDIPELTVTGKHIDQTDWTDLETTGLDLSEWNGSRETFQIRLQAGEILTVDLVDFSISVGI